MEPLSRWLWFWNETVDRGIDAGLEAVAITSMVALALAAIGASSRAAPHCRRCGVDLRPLVRAKTTTCACGADASGRGAVRWRGRSRSARWIAALATIVVVTTSMRAWSVMSDHRWRDLRRESSLLSVIESDMHSIDERAYAIAAQDLARRFRAGRHSSDAMRRAFTAVAQEERKPLAQAAAPLLAAIRHCADDALFAEMSERATESASGTVTREAISVDGTRFELVAGGVSPIWPWWSASRWTLVAVRRVTLGDAILWDSSTSEAPDPRLTLGGRLADAPKATFVGIPSREPLLTVDGLVPGPIDLTVYLSLRLVDMRVARALAAAGVTLAEFDAQSPESRRAELRLVQPLMGRPTPSALTEAVATTVEVEP